MMQYVTYVTIGFTEMQWRQVGENDTQLYR